MSASSLLIRGMLTGLFASLIVFVFAHTFGEPLIDQAIAFEDHMHQLAGDSPEPELVSRAVQSTCGLRTGVTVYGTAIGGIFALVFAFIQNRLWHLRARSTSALIALAGFVTLFLAPQLKYPANPPSIGDPDTIRVRTALYFGMILWSLLATIAASTVTRRLMRKLDLWDAALGGAGVYIAAMVAAMLLLPPINEVPKDFPAALLWQFRVASLAGHAILLTTLGLVFGYLVEHQPERLRTAAGHLPRAR
jgi:predicted cobalt transporter CbtA